MKSNVDLSENRIFTTPTPPTDPIIIELSKFLKISKPWDFLNNPKWIGSDLDLEISNKGKKVFAVGNKKERQRWKRNQASYADEICGRCGESRGRKPWAKKECNCYSMRRTKRIPW